MQRIRGIAHYVLYKSTLGTCESFLADRTNGRAIATLLRLSSVVVFDVMYCG